MIISDELNKMSNCPACSLFSAWWARQFCVIPESFVCPVGATRHGSTERGVTLQHTEPSLTPTFTL